MNSPQQGGIAGRLARLFAGNKDERAAAAHYVQAVARARRPELYADFHVPDTPAGRFEMVAWQVLVELAALNGQGPAGRRLAQELVDRMFVDMDRSLRELGVGDLSVGREMRKLGEAWQARIELAERVFPPPGAAATPERTAELAAFLQKNAAGDDGGPPVDGAGLARDIMAMLEQLRSAGESDRPPPAP
jgi:cytochrome b pre-mRNA-processing protein 3